MGKEDPKGTYNRAPIFKGENYVYWKEYIMVHLISVAKRLWVAIKDVPFIPKNNINDVFFYKITKGLK